MLTESLDPKRADFPNSIAGLSERLLSLGDEFRDVEIAMLWKEADGIIENSGPLTKIVLKVGGRGLSKEIAVYVTAVSMLLLYSVDVDSYNLTKLLSAVDMPPDMNMMKAILSSKLNNIASYFPMLYYLGVIGKEPTVELLDSIAVAVGLPSNLPLAAHALNLFREIVNDSWRRGARPSNKADAMEETRAILASMITTMARIVNGEVKDALSRKGMMEMAAAGYLNYFSTYVIFVSNGIPITRDAVMRILECVGITPEDRMLDFLSTMNYESATLAYVAAIYLIVSSGKEPTLKGINKVMEALGKTADSANAAFFLKEYNDTRR